MGAFLFKPDSAVYSISGNVGAQQCAVLICVVAKVAHPVLKPGLISSTPNTYMLHDAGNIGFPGKLYTAVFHHVRQQYPWWNLTAGRNHVVSNSNDRGCCDLYRMGPDVQHPIKVCVCV